MAPLNQMKKSAERFLNQQGWPIARDRIGAVLQLCGADLAQRFSLDEADAYDLALSVWSEMSGRETRCFIDVALTTPYLLFIVDPVSGGRRPIPLQDLLQYLGPRPVQQPAAPAGQAG